MTSALPPLPHGVARLSHLGVLQIEGEDAARFIHGQLTQDFSLLGPEEARLAAFCSAKGRMLASFIGIKPESQRVLLLCSQDLLAPTLKRLSMFVLRAKARLSDVSAQYALYGSIAAPTDTSATPATATPWQVHTAGPAWVVNLYPALGVARHLWISPLDAPPPPGPTLDASVWLWSEVRSGVATLSAPVAEAFVPQMLNYESIGGVNFQKGCYPGQEVVARSQFRGTLKRRAFVAHIEEGANGDASGAGQAVFAADDAEQPAGSVVQIAPCPSGGWDAIVSLQVQATEHPPLRLGSSAGPVLQLLPLPYVLREDI